MIIEIRKIAKNIKISSPDLITRPTGKSFYSRIMKKLNDVHPGEVVILDFNAIKVLDSSFIDECLVSLLKESQRENIPFHVRLQNVSDSMESNIEFVIKSYFSMNNEKIAVSLDRMGRSQGNYIGALSEDEKDIVDFLMINKHVSAEEIASYTGFDVENTEKILDSLYAIRVIRRSKEGATYYYSPV